MTAATGQLSSSPLHCGQGKRQNPWPASEQVQIRLTDSKEVRSQPKMVDDLQKTYQKRSLRRIYAGPRQGLASLGYPASLNAHRHVLQNKRLSKPLRPPLRHSSAHEQANPIRWRTEQALSGINPDSATDRGLNETDRQSILSYSIRQSSNEASLATMLSFQPARSSTNLTFIRQLRCAESGSGVNRLLQTLRGRCRASSPPTRIPLWHTSNPNMEAVNWPLDARFGGKGL